MVRLRGGQRLQPLAELAERHRLVRRQHALDDRHHGLLVLGQLERRVALLEQQVGPALLVVDDARLEAAAHDQVEQRGGEGVVVAGPGVALVRQRQRDGRRRVVGRLREVRDRAVGRPPARGRSAGTRGRRG